MRWILGDAIRNLWSALAEESLVVHLGAGCLILEAIAVTITLLVSIVIVALGLTGLVQIVTILGVTVDCSHQKDPSPTVILEWKEYYV